MKITVLKNLSSSLTTIMLMTSVIIVGCDSDNNSAELAKAVELESQRAQGTIIELVTIVGDHIRLKAGETHQLSAVGIDSNNETRDITNELVWSSSDPDIATIDSKGLVTAVANSNVNKGIVTITGTTINDVYGEGEVSVNDSAVTNISLKQTSPETGNIFTCIDARIKGDVVYEDGYTSMDTVKDMIFSLDDNTSATIGEDGTLYTSAAVIESTTVTAKIANISGRLTVTADPQNLENLDILLDDKTITLLTLNVGESVQVNGRASLVGDTSKNDINIDNAISWSQEPIGYAGITTIGDKKGTVFALKPGVTQLVGSCGGKNTTAVLEVKGEADLDFIQINDGSDIITLAPLESVELTLTANYLTTPSSLNVSEFAQWSINGSNILDAELIAIGTDKVSYKLTSTSSTSGGAIVSVTYDGITENVQINIE
ncbi:Ig-like domain-containing protein [Alteromonadaceae bacterium BrNp21-10]|nr:Ig-like domain-containing protein [Alteromonadaceae bacterium BrNp21-10]